MSDHSDSHDMQKHVRTYWMIFWALMVGTFLTVAMFYVELQSVALTIAVALFIASIKASLVAGFFMHLISEKKSIYLILASTIFFFIGMMALTIMAKFDVPMIIR